MDDIFKILVDSFIPFVGIVFGMVEFLKGSLGLDGKIVTVLSFVIGIIVGTTVYLSYLFPASGQYVVGGLFIVASGLVASGYYKFISARLPSND